MSLFKDNAAAIVDQPKEKTRIPICRERFIAQRIRIGEQDKRSMSECSFDDHVLVALNGDDFPVRCQSIKGVAAEPARDRAEQS